jgi:hypothetical protein
MSFDFDSRLLNIIKDDYLQLVVFFSCVGDVVEDEAGPTVSSWRFFLSARTLN